MKKGKRGERKDWRKILLLLRLLLQYDFFKVIEKDNDNIFG